MADSEEARRGDSHDWNSLENYIFLHEKHLDEHALVLEGSSLEFREIATPNALYDVLVVEGIVLCSNGLHLEVNKLGDIDRSPARRVRMNLYSYNAWQPGGHNALRYDNQHRRSEDVYHRHLFDLATGRQIAFTTMPRHEFPVLHTILDELMDLFPPAS